MLLSRTPRRKPSIPSFTQLLLVDELREAWRSEPRPHRLTLVIICLAGTALRVAHLGQPIRYDEAVTWLYFGRLDWLDAISTYTYPNNHLLHTALLKAVAIVGGADPWVLRLPAFVAGTLAIPATYALARSLYSGSVALLAAALVAGNGALTLYASNARGYSIVVLLFLLLALQAIRLHESESREGWLSFALIGALGLWTVPVMLYPLGTVFLWLGLVFALERRRQSLRSLGIAAALTAVITAVAYAPVVTRNGFTAVFRNRFVAPSDWMTFFQELPISVGGALESWSLGLPLAIALVLAYFAFFALRHHRSLSRFPAPLPLAAFVFSCWLLVINHRAPFSRVWLWAVPIGAMLVSAGWHHFASRFGKAREIVASREHLIAGAVAIVLSLAVALSRVVWKSNDTGTYRDAAAAADWVSNNVRPGDRVVAAIPTNAPLHFSLVQRAADTSALFLDERRAQRIYAVIDGGEGQQLADVIALSSARDRRAFSAPVVVARFPGSAVVRFDRNVPAP